MSDFTGWDWFWLSLFAYVAAHALWSGFLSAVAAIGQAWRGERLSTDRSRQSAVPRDDEPASSGSLPASTETPTTETPNA